MLSLPTREWRQCERALCKIRNAAFSDSEGYIGDWIMATGESVSARLNPMGPTMYSVIDCRLSRLWGRWDDDPSVAWDR
jgi:hypothetical protein